MQRNESPLGSLRLFGKVLVWERVPLLLFVVSGLLAVYVGFLSLEAEMLKALIGDYGYYFITLVFVLFVYYALRVWRTAEHTSREKAGWGVWVGVIVGTLLLWGGDYFRHKLLYDEYVLQATSLSMHLDKQVHTPMRGHWLQGSYLLMDGYLDKRPYFFSYLVSLVHDLTGYRAINGIVLNALLVPVFLAICSRIVLFYSGRVATYIALGLFGTLPILAQVGSGGGLEMLNITMLAVVTHACILYLAQPGGIRLGYLCVSAVLLTQCRYESIVYLPAVGAVIMLGWWKTGRVSVSVAFGLLPLFCVPAVWQSRYVDASPMLWELRPGQVARFSSEYLKGNLEGMWNFFTSLGPALPNSVLLGLVGVLGSVVAVLLGLRRIRQKRPLEMEWAALISMMGATLLVMVLFLFYYWARLDDIPACRFSLPIYLFLTLVAALSLAWLARGRAWVLRCFWFLWLINLMAFYVPSSAKRLFTVTNLTSAATKWQVDYVNSLPKVPRLVVGYSPLPWLGSQYSVVGVERAQLRTKQIEFHVREGSFQEVLVMQSFTPSTDQGDFVLVEGAQFPEHWKLEPLTMRRFGGRLMRISRVKIEGLEGAAQGAAMPLAHSDQEPCTAAWISASESR